MDSTVFLSPFVSEPAVRYLQEDMVLNQPTVSRRHLLIKRTGKDTYVIRDLMTSNGSYVGKDRERLLPDKDLPIKPGDTFEVGGVLLKLID